MRELNNEFICYTKVYTELVGIQNCIHQQQVKSQPQTQIPATRGKVFHSEWEQISCGKIHHASDEIPHKWSELRPNSYTDIHSDGCEEDISNEKNLNDYGKKYTKNWNGNLPNVSGKFRSMCGKLRSCKWMTKPTALRCRRGNALWRSSRALWRVQRCVAALLREYFVCVFFRYLRLADMAWRLLCLLTVISITQSGSAFVQTMQEERPPGPPKANYYTGESANVSLLLDSILNGYDKRLRPNYKVRNPKSDNPERRITGPPVEVGITMFVFSVSSISELDMDFTLDFYFRQYWKDPRLQFDDEDELCISNEMLSKIWWPDTFFANAKDAKFHFATTKNAFLRIKPTGEISQSIRLTVTAMCNMDLTFFPMDSQKCSLEIESYGYSVKDIKYHWNTEKGSPVGVDPSVQLPQFMVKGFKTTTKVAELSTGNYSRLACEIFFVRSLGYYIIQIYVPSCLIVVLSWVSFWLSREAVPARVALGITTVLTMTTLISSTNSSLPKISYLKAIDVYLIVCFFMVFASLMEYAAVSYMSNRFKKHPPQVTKRRNSDPHNRTCEKLANHGCNTSSPPPVNTEVRLSSQMRKLHSECDFKQLSSGNYVAVTPCRPRLSLDEADGDISSGFNNFVSCGAVQCCTKPNTIDKYSRVFFPVSFIGFNILYWVIYLHVPRDDDFIPNPT